MTTFWCKLDSSKIQKILRPSVMLVKIAEKHCIWHSRQNFRSKPPVLLCTSVLWRWQCRTSAVRSWGQLFRLPAILEHCPVLFQMWFLLGYSLHPYLSKSQSSWHLPTWRPTEEFWDQEKIWGRKPTEDFWDQEKIRGRKSSQQLIAGYGEELAREQSGLALCSSFSPRLGSSSAIVASFGL